MDVFLSQVFTNAEQIVDSLIPKAYTDNSKL